jgi:hypothetical protein
MSRISVKCFIVRLTACVAMLLLCAVHSAHAQNIGAGNLRFEIDNFTVLNGYNDGGTAQAITLGTQLIGSVSVSGVTGNGGSTSVTCYANKSGIVSQIFSWSTTTSASNTFPWKPSTTGTYGLFCSATWTGVHVNGTVTTPTINIPVNP